MMQGKVLVVTGALGALGRVVAEIAQSRGARIAAIDHAPSQVPATTERIEIGGVDLSDSAQAKAAIEAAVKHFGRLDALVNIAGGFAFETVGDGDIKTWHRMHALNVLTALNASHAALPHLAASKAGRIVNIGSINGQAGQYGQVNYAAAKSGIHGFTKALSQEGARFGVTVNAIAPGYIDTDMVAAVPPEVLEKIVAKIPVGRLGQAHEIARGVAFLCSDEAGFVTGSTLSINGGQHMS